MARRVAARRPSSAKTAWAASSSWSGSTLVGLGPLDFGREARGMGIQFRSDGAQGGGPQAVLGENRLGGVQQLVRIHLGGLGAPGFWTGGKGHGHPIPI